MRVKVELKGMEEVKEAVKKSLSKDMEIKKEVYGSARDIQRQAKYNLKALEAWDTGHLSKTIIVELTPDAFGAEIGTTAPYGPYVESGTRPHFPPPDALEAWARHHGFASAWPICLAISRRGLPARPYLYPAYFALENEFYERLKKILEK